MSEITVVDIEPQTVLGVRKQGRYEEIAMMIVGLFLYAVGRGIQIEGRPIFVCHEMTPEEAMKAYEEGNADIEVALPVSGEVEGGDGVECYQLPGGKMAKIAHKGPYQDCGSAHEKLYAWLGEQGKKLAGPTREVYMNDPREVPPEEILTEVYAPME